jgi:CheY-like chemotaxis protein
MELGKTLPKPVAPAPVVIQVQGRVLFAEDGIDNQRLIGVILRKAGCEVTIVENGQQTLDAVHAAQAKGEAFDLILSDMMMPVMDGYTSVARLRSEGYKGPIVALTAHAMAGEKERCLAVGCDDFATKPVNRQSLLETVRYHIELGQQTGTKSQELTAIGN